MIMVTQHDGSVLIVGGFAHGGLLAGAGAPATAQTTVPDGVAATGLATVNLAAPSATPAGQPGRATPPAADVASGPGRRRRRAS